MFYDFNIYFIILLQDIKQQTIPEEKINLTKTEHYTTFLDFISRGSTSIYT